MKVKVTRKFRDIHTGERYKKGDLLEITEERYAEIVSVGNFVHQIAQNDALSVGTETANALSTNAKEALTGDSTATGDGFDIMSIRELKEYADVTYKLTFKAGAKKAEIIETLRRMENGK